ncbi:hypothetical protein V9K67_08465 [Paraflavisolibacter sp. H34]|uniref:hypothetical protein n=1 Tax=Huijunlia imazamoxiresistens TaxID=3127457 RepID=UPI00301A4D7C
MILKAIGRFVARVVSNIFRLDKVVMFILSFLMTATAAMAEEKARAREEAVRVEEQVAVPPATVATAPAAATVKAPQTALPYKPTYASRFEIGDQGHAQKVLEVYKDYENNSLDGRLFATSLEVQYPEGFSVKGRDEVLARMREERSGLASIKNTIGTVLAFQSPGRPESWVSVWARSEAVGRDGVKTRSSVNEIWRINKDGLIDFMRRYDSNHQG